MKIKKKHKAKMIAFLIIVLIVLLYILYCAEKRISLVVCQMAQQNVKANAALIISKTVFDELEENDITYESLVKLEKDNDGKVCSLETDILKVNRLKSVLSVEILHKLEQSGEMTLNIPIGTLLGSEIISGRGPDIKVKFIPIGTVAVQINNNITSSGINQTLHQIELQVNVQIEIITALRNTQAEISSNICIAETVIVGNVPDTYTEIDAHTGAGDGNGIGLEPDDIFNFVY